MALDDIIEKILGDAHTQISEIEQAASKERDDIANANKKAIDFQTQKILKNADQDVTQILEQAKIAAHLDGQKALLATKQKMLDECFSKTATAFTKMDSSTYMKLIESLILSSVATGTEKLIFDAKDKERIDQDFIKKIQVLVAQKCPQSNIEFAFDDSGLIQGGFILEGNKMRIENTIQAMLAELRTELEAEIAQILFA